MQIDAALPVAPVGVEVSDDVGLFSSIHTAIERDFSVGKIIDLADAGAYQFAAGVRIQDAAGQCEGELVGIADAVTADKTVVAEQLGDGEVGDAGVEQRDVALLFEWHVEIIQPWFQCLLITAAERTFEKQAGVDAAHRQVAVIDVLCGAGIIGVTLSADVILCVVEFDRRFKEPCRAAQRQAQAGHHVKTVAGGFGDIFMGEVDVFGIKSE